MMARPSPLCARQHGFVLFFNCLALLFVALLADRLGQLLSAAAAPSTPATNHAELIADVIDWVRDNGGYINDKVEVRAIPDAGIHGIFAKGALSKGEAVCRVPWDLVIKPPDGEWGDCAAVWAVHEEMKSGATPYGRYLAARPRRILPGYWSDEGQELLYSLLGGWLPPSWFNNIIFSTWTELCDRDDAEDDEDVLFARLLVTTRSEGDDFLVPFHDLINHRNGRWYNTNPRYEDGEYFELVTIRDVEPGEQLHNSYNQCDWCDDWRYVFGTPELFGIYGFVELMPQRYVIEDVRLKFDIDEKEDGSGELEVDFAVPPSKRGLAYLQGSLQRLDWFERANKDKDHASVPQNELNLIWQYHSALRIAFSHAYESAEGQVSEEVWELGDDWAKVELEEESDDGEDEGSGDADGDDIKKENGTDVDDMEGGGMRQSHSNPSVAFAQALEGVEGQVSEEVRKLGEEEEGHVDVVTIDNGGHFDRTEGEAFVAVGKKADTETRMMKSCTNTS